MKALARPAGNQVIFLPKMGTEPHWEMETSAATARPMSQGKTTYL
jgi:hypothetical protein